ncbi:hypothetical protein MRB53_035528 [Persea americana]|uniref:Uncharacterized protein n=1 Tax=Persea americana TaxID=3435 RepID=A0ACC2K4X1_PERAE|nr:hypothetical protein MRB53_035528 [Persea americana]
MVIVSSPETTEDDIYRSIQRAIHGTILHSKDDWSHPIYCDEAFAENMSNKCAVLGELCKGGELLDRILSRLVLDFIVLVASS